MTSRRDELLPDLVWLVPVVLAVAATCVTTEVPEVVLPLLVVAVVPWVALVLGRAVPTWAFVLLGIGPVVGILVADGLSASVFLGTTVLTLLASRAERGGQVALVVAAGVLLPFASLLSERELDLGAIYFAIGNLFGIVVGVLLGHTRRLDDRLRVADARLTAVAAQEERTRLARDVHDLVAHSLTVVVLQVGGARRVLRSDPDRAEAALEQAERVGRESLDGVREVVGLLRTPDDASGPATDLALLAGTYRDAGVDVRLTADPRVADLPLLVRGTGYRVVQEALANAARYRRPGSVVEVRTSVSADEVAVEVSNPAPSGAAVEGHRPSSGGYGLAGLREQVSAIGGTLSTGPVGDRWVVACRLPLGVAPRTAAVTR